MLNKIKLITKQKLTVGTYIWNITVYMISRNTAKM